MTRCTSKCAAHGAKLRWTPRADVIGVAASGFSSWPTLSCVEDCPNFQRTLVKESFAHARIADSRTACRDALCACSSLRSQRPLSALASWAVRSSASAASGGVVLPERPARLRHAASGLGAAVAALRLRRRARQLARRVERQQEGRVCRARRSLGGGGARVGQRLVVLGVSEGALRKAAFDGSGTSALFFDAMSACRQSAQGS